MSFRRYLLSNVIEVRCTRVGQQTQGFSNQFPVQNPAESALHLG